MKFLKKASLAAAIAAAPFAVNAEMVALDDATMSATTGQAGVTIEIEIGSDGITVGGIEYTDTGSGATGGGSVLLQNLKVSNVNNLKQTIDVDENGNLLLGMSDVTGMKIELGDVATEATGKFSAVALRSAAGETTELVNNLDMTLNLGESTTTIMNLAAAGNDLNTLPVNARDGSVAIVANSSLRITDMNIGAFGYTLAQAEGKNATMAAGIQSGDATIAATAAAKANAVIAQYNDNNGAAPDVAAATAGTALTAEQQTAIKATIAKGSAVQISGLEFYKLEAGADGVIGTGDDVKGMATVAQTIWAKGGPAVDSAGDSIANGGGVYIQVGAISGTLDIAGISMGGASIGSVKVSDINLAGMTQRIYGH